MKMNVLKDGGVTVHNDDPELAARLKLCSKKLNLAEHLCGVTEESLQTLSTCIDLEGHLGTVFTSYSITLDSMLRMADTTC
jgi:hypothetical protein